MASTTGASAAGMGHGFYGISRTLVNPRDIVDSRP
jgi:hypothetical protein